MSKTIQTPSMEELLSVGAHFGHKSSRWNPKMETYIYDEREGVHIIDVVKTLKLTEEALAEIQKASEKGAVLFVGTKGQASNAIKRVANEMGAFYVTNRWPGGLFTNFKMIRKSIRELVKLEEVIASGADGYVKKEQLLLERDVQRMNNMYEGLKFMDKLPSLVVIVDSRLEKNAVREAKNLGIKSIALLDTNCDPDMVDIPVPCNDDSIKSIELFINLFGEAIKGTKGADRILSLRQSHEAKVTELRAEFENKMQREMKMMEDKAQRLKRIREGGDEAQPILRVVKEEATEEVEEASEFKALDEYDLSARTVKALKEAGYITADKVAELTKSELTAIKGIGEVAAAQVIKELSS